MSNDRFHKDAKWVDGNIQEHQHCMAGLLYSVSVIKACISDEGREASGDLQGVLYLIEDRVAQTKKHIDRMLLLKTHLQSCDEQEEEPAEQVEPRPMEVAKTGSCYAAFQKTLLRYNSRQTWLPIAAAVAALALGIVIGLSG